jgi:RNA 3'-terminal phosphate cyclase (ATP)
VSKRAVERLRKLIKTSANVEEHLADQLLLPMAIAGKGSFTTTEPSLHTKTNINVIKQFGVEGVSTEQLSSTLWRVKTSS